MVIVLLGCTGRSASCWLNIYNDAIMLGRVFRNAQVQGLVELRGGSDGGRIRGNSLQGPRYSRQALIS